MENYKRFWLLLVAAHIAIAIPNATVTKAVVDSVDPLVWVLTRSLFLVVVVTPFVWRKIPGLFDVRVRKLAFISALCMALSVILSIYAIAYSQASYVSTVTLLAPIAIMITSMIVFRERMKPRAAVGVGVAGIGAFVLVALPALLSGVGLAFYPLATALILINIVVFSIAIVTLRVLNQRRHVPLSAMVWYGGVLTALLSGASLPFLGTGDLAGIDSPWYWLAGLYAGVVLMFIGRLMMIKILEVVPPAVFGVAGYVETFGAIIFPVLVLGETISVTMAVGGLLIFLGVYLIESHTRPHYKHQLLHRHQ